MKRFALRAAVYLATPLAILGYLLITPLMLAVYAIDRLDDPDKIVD